MACQINDLKMIYNHYSLAWCRPLICLSLFLYFMKKDQLYHTSAPIKLWAALKAQISEGKNRCLFRSTFISQLVPRSWCNKPATQVWNTKTIPSQTTNIWIYLWIFPWDRVVVEVVMLIMMNYLFGHAKSGNQEYKHKMYSDKINSTLKYNSIVQTGCYYLQKC